MKLLNISFAVFMLLLTRCETVNKPGSNGTDSTLASTDTTTKSDAITDVFTGKLRADVKTSYVNFPADTFFFIKDFHKWLPDDEYMHKYSDARFNDRPRCKEENKNVVLADLFIYGVKREDDNDYHIILGSSHKLHKDQPYFSAEISGLHDPSSASYQTLKAVRAKFKAYFGDDINKEYVFVASEKHPPIHIDYISGSLFFDNHHYSGHSSVQGFKVCSAWEIHPVTSIVFSSSQ